MQDEINSKILPVKSDNLAHDLINDKDINVIEWIVMTILNLSFNDVHEKCSIQNVRLTRTNPKDKNKYVDFIFKYDNHFIILEVNNNFTGLIVRNTLFGMAKTLLCYQVDNISKSRLNNKKIYEKIYRIHVINLNWYKKGMKLPPEEKKYNQLFADANAKKGVFFEVINVTLDKYANMSYNKIKKCDKFYKLLTIDNKKELLEYTKNEPLLENYVNKLIKFSNMNKYMEDTMEWSLETDKFIEESIAYTEGIEQGIEKEKQNIVLSMYKDNQTLDKIAKYTNLSIDKIKKIIKETNN